MPSEESATGDQQIPVGKCTHCGYVYGDDLDYRFPNASECSCGDEVDQTTVADPDTVEQLAQEGLKP